MHLPCTPRASDVSALYCGDYDDFSQRQMQFRHMQLSALIAYVVHWWKAGAWWQHRFRCRRCSSRSEPVSDIRSYTSLSLIDPQYAKSHAPTPACVQRPENKRLVSGRRFEPCAAANRSARALPTAHSCGDEVGGRLRPRPRPGDGRTDGRQSSITGCLAPISSSVCHVVSDART